MYNHEWFRLKHYLHFDGKIHKSQIADVVQKITDPQFVSTHGFLPFLKYEKNVPKFMIDATGKPGTKIKKREICYAAHWDAQIYSYYSHLLNKLYEIYLANLALSENVIAFRKIKDQFGNSKSNMHFAGDAFNEIRKLKNCRVYAFDISKFFDSLNSSVLKRQWCNVLNVKTLPDDHYAIFRSVTKFSFIERDVVFDKFRISKDPRNHKKINRICEMDDFRFIKKDDLISIRKVGIPQGSPISATLANIYMLEFDKNVSQTIHALGGKYYRYCDDIFIAVPEDASLDIPNFVSVEIEKQGLKLNTDKTDDAIFYESEGKLRCTKGIQYLGFIFDGVSISLRPSAISTYRRKVRKAINRAIAKKLTRDKANRVLGLPPSKIRLKKVIRDYSHLGQLNFITYGRRAQMLLGSETIRHQLADLHRFLEEEVKGAKQFANDY